METRVRKSGETDRSLSPYARVRRAFTLIEILVVISIISLLLSILVPALGVVRRKASILCGIVNQRSTVTSVSLYANDNGDRYPDSIATAGSTDGDGGVDDWNWTDPRLMIGYSRSYNPRMSDGGSRSMSAYLKNYIDDPETLHCTNVPDKYRYIQESWQAGDNWDNPDRIEGSEPMTGSYCFWWDYKGWLSDQEKVFSGPRRVSGGKGQSQILVSDYFGSDTWRNWGEYGSCESFVNAGITSSNSLLSNFYIGGDITQNPPNFKLNAAFTDGHVESYSSLDVVALEVSKRPDGTKPFRQKIGKGKFYLPRSSMP